MTDRRIKRSGPGQVVLLVDGEVLVRHAIADYLRECGYDVIEAASSDEALVVLDDKSVRLDVVLCDVAIPGPLSGFELSVRIRSRRPGLQVVLAGSIPAQAGAAAELCDEGPQLERPYDPQGVVEHIRKMLGTRGKGEHQV